MRRPKIKVTAAHIARNVQADCTDCAIAVAIRDSLGSHWHVMENDAREDRDGDGMFRGKRIRFTPLVRRLIRALDRGESVEPFEF